MKDGTRYASQVKSVFSKLRQKKAKPDLPDEEPLRRLAVAILAAESQEEQAQRAVDRLLAGMDSWNEVRVSTPAELLRAIGNTIPNGKARCEQLVTALQCIFDRENRMSLDRLKSMGRRDARQYLEKLEGVDEYVAASVMLWSLGGHAVPVNDRLFEALRKAELVHPTATRAEVQAFLERNISANDAKEFCAVMRSFQGRTTNDARRRRGSPRSRKTKTAKK